MARVGRRRGGGDDPDRSRPYDVIGETAANAAIMLSVLGLPAATGVAILRYRLYDIDVVINRTLVYGSLTAILAGVYIGSVLVLEVALSGFTEELWCSRWPARPSPSQRCSVLPVDVSRERWTAASTGASTTRSAPSRPSRRTSATRWTSLH